MLQNNLAVLLELSGDVAGAETALRAALAEDPSLPQISKNLADILYRNGRYDEAREAYERAAKLAPDLGDDLYFKLGNIAYKRRDKARARESWSRATTLNPGHELARANLDMLDMAPMSADDAGLRRAGAQDLPEPAASRSSAYKDKCIRRRIAVRMRACGVHTLRRLPRRCSTRTPDEYERLRDALTINVTRFYRNAETWNLLRRDVLPGLLDSPTHRGSGRWSAGCSSGEEPYTLALLVADYLERDGRRDAAGAAHDRRHRHRPREPGARARRRVTGARALTELPDDLARALLRGRGDRAARHRPAAPTGAGPSARPEPRGAAARTTTTSSSAATS